MHGLARPEEALGQFGQPIAVQPQIMKTFEAGQSLPVNRLDLIMAEVEALELRHGADALTKGFDLH